MRGFLMDCAVNYQWLRMCLEPERLISVIRSSHQNVWSCGLWFHTSMAHNY